MKIKFLIITVFMLTTLIVRSQIPLSAPVFLISAGDEKEGQPIFKILTSSDPQFRKARKLFDRGFTNHVVTLYKLAQQYQVTHGKLAEVEEAYLAFTDVPEQVAQVGFWLQTSNGLIHKPNANFVAINAKKLESARDELNAPPQMFNYEMGHLILNTLTGATGVIRDRPSQVMHYFTTLTDYNTAFYEGFAEHLEYMTIEFERDKTIKDTIIDKIRLLKLKLPRTMYGYERDYNLPLRMGFYTSTMPFWYHDIETVRRASFIRNNWAKMPARIASGISQPKEYIHYRNASVWPNPAGVRTYEESMSSEGIVAQFFSHILQNDMTKSYMAPQFYREFIPDTSVRVPQQIDVTTNQYLKMFQVIATSANRTQSPGGPLSNFIDAYYTQFPQETVYIKSCWEEASGHPYTANPAPEIWVTNNNCKFYPYSQSPFGPSIPFYTFNLNTADTMDLMTFNGIDRSDAEKILAWRIQNQGFKSTSEVLQTPDVEAKKLKLIAESEPNKSTVTITSAEHQSWKPFLAYSIIHLLKMSLIWFILIGTVYAFMLVFYAKTNPTPLRMTAVLLKVLMFAAVGMIIQLMMIKQLMFMFLFIVIVLVINYLTNRKKEQLLWFSIGSTAAIGLVMLYSLW